MLDGQLVSVVYVIIVWIAGGLCASSTSTLDLLTLLSEDSTFTTLDDSFMSRYLFFNEDYRRSQQLATVVLTMEATMSLAWNSSAAAATLPLEVSCLANRPAPLLGSPPTNSSTVEVIRDPTMIVFLFHRENVREEEALYNGKSALHCGTFYIGVTSDADGETYLSSWTLLLVDQR